MTRGKKLGILALLLIALMALTLLVIRFAPVTGEEEETAETVFTLDADQVTSLSWTYAGENITIEKDAETNWSYPADTDFPMDATYPDAMLQALTEIQAEKTIEVPEDLAQYGLSDGGTCTITVEADQTYTLTLGDETGLGGQRYLTTGDGKVYLVEESLLTTFQHSLLDLVQTETLPDMSDLNSLTIQAGQSTLTIDHTENSGLAYSDLYTWFWNQDGKETALDTEQTRTLADAVTGLTWSSCAAYNATEEQLSAYGLLSPSATITVHYTESSQVATNETDEDGETVYETKETAKTLTLELGDYDGETCFARISGSHMVYRVDSSFADQILAAKGTDLLPQQVLNLDWTQVTGVDVTVEGATDTLTKKTETETDEDGNETEQYVYQLDGKTVEVTDIFDRIQDLETTGSDAGATPGETLLALTIHQDSEKWPEVTLTFFVYDSSMALVTLNGDSRLLVDREDVESIVEALTTALDETA